MRYLKVRWLHSHPDEPTLLYSEIDDDGWETRKVEVFADGRVGYADATEETPPTGLGLAPVPPLEEIAADPQFEPEAISRDEFERVWAERRAVRECS